MADAFVGTGLNAWNVAKVNTMAYTFQDATAFNSDLSGWDVSSVTSMLQMVSGGGSVLGS